MNNQIALRRLVAIAMAVTGVVACGEHVIDLYGDQVSAPPSALDAGTRVLTDQVTPPPLCPSDPYFADAGDDDGGSPDAGLPECFLGGAVCEYGPSPDPACNRTYTCTSATDPWRERANSRCFATICPDKLPASALEGTPCALEGGDDNDEALCTMEDGVCACTRGRGGDDTHDRRWVCTKPILGCPIIRPNIGQPCGDDIICDYGSCRSKRGAAMKCASGVWEATSFSCAL